MYESLSNCCQERFLIIPSLEKSIIQKQISFADCQTNKVKQWKQNSQMDIKRSQEKGTLQENFVSPDLHCKAMDSNTAFLASGKFLEQYLNLDHTFLKAI